MIRRLAFAVVAAVALTARLGAHPVPFSYVDVRLEDDRTEVAIVAHVFDLAHDLGIEPPERLLDQTTVAARGQEIVDLLSSRLQIEVSGAVIECQAVPALEILPERQSIVVRLVCPQSLLMGASRLRAALFPYDPEHQTFLTIYERGVLAAEGVFDHRHDTYDHAAGTRQDPAAVIRRFVPAGVHHILIGPDHVLFLVGLLLLGGSLRRLAVVITAFTLAHSLTLSLAVLDIVRPSPLVVEPMIALSIVCVGVTNLLRPGGRDLRAWFALLFGLVHGFGFASVLQDMSLPRHALGWSLFSFNVGVEVGQLVVVLIAGTMLAAVRARSNTVGRRIAFAGSIAVAAAGAFWFVQRLIMFYGRR